MGDSDTDEVRQTTVRVQEGNFEGVYTVGFHELDR